MRRVGRGETPPGGNHGAATFAEEGDDHSEDYSLDTQMLTELDGHELLRLAKVYDHNLTFPQKLLMMLTYVDKEERKRQISESVPGKRQEEGSDYRSWPICWSDDGKAFTIRSQKRFVEEVLPLFFKETKFPSFTRKCYRWGFRQICIPTRKSDPQDRVMTFGHEQFCRDNLALISNMTNATAAERERRKEKRAFTTSMSTTASNEPAKGGGKEDEERGTREKKKKRRRRNAADDHTGEARTTDDEQDDTKKSSVSDMEVKRISSSRDDHQGSQEEDMGAILALRGRTGEEGSMTLPPQMSRIAAHQEPGIFDLCFPGGYHNSSLSTPHLLADTSAGNTTDALVHEGSLAASSVTARTPAPGLASLVGSSSAQSIGLFLQQRRLLDPTTMSLLEGRPINSGGGDSAAAGIGSGDSAAAGIGSGSVTSLQHQHHDAASIAAAERERTINSLALALLAQEQGVAFPVTSSASLLPPPPAWWPPHYSREATMHQHQQLTALQQLRVAGGPPPSEPGRLSQVRASPGLMSHIVNNPTASGVLPAGFGGTMIPPHNTTMRMMGHHAPTSADGEEQGRSLASTMLLRSMAGGDYGSLLYPGDSARLFFLTQQPDAANSSIFPVMSLSTSGNSDRATGAVGSTSGESARPSRSRISSNADVGELMRFQEHGEGRGPHGRN